MIRFLRREAGQTIMELSICVGVVGCAAWAMMLLSGADPSPGLEVVWQLARPLRELIGQL